MPTGAKQTVRFGPFELDEQCGQLRKDGLGLKLQGQPIQILEILLEHPGELVSREQLRERLWASDTFVDFDHSLNTAIKKLRQTLGDEAEMPRYIETLPKRGYRFVAEAKRDGSVETRAPEPPAPDLLEKHRDLPSRNRRRLTKVVVTAGACLVVFVGVAVAYWRTRPIPQPKIVASHQITKTGGFKLWKLLTDGTYIYFDESGLYQVAAKGGEVTQLHPFPARAAFFLNDISRDGSELLVHMKLPSSDRYDIWSQPLPAGPARLIVRDGMWAVWTPDGRSILFRRGTGWYRCNPDGTNERFITDPKSLARVAISPDGKRIRYNVLRLRNTWEAQSDGSNPHAILAGHKDGVVPGAWSPDGKYYFFRSFDGDRYNLWAVAETKATGSWGSRKIQAVQLTFGPYSIGEFTISRDGKQIFATVIDPHGELSVYEPKSHTLVPYLSGIPASFVDFSRDGKWIAYVSIPEGDLWRSKVDGTERMQLTWPPYCVVSPRWSPDGKLILFEELCGGDRRHLGENPRMYVISADGGQPMLLPGEGAEGEVGDPTWSTDGRAIAYSSGGAFAGKMVDLRVLDLNSQKSSKLPGSEGFWSARWSPDGKYLVALSGSPPNRLMLFTFANQEWKQIASGFFVGWPAWTRDSKRLFFEDGFQVMYIDIPNGRPKTVPGPWDSFRRASSLIFWNMDWFGVNPDGKVITARDTSVREIYAFDLEYK